MITREIYKQILKLLTGREWSNEEYFELVDKYWSENVNHE